MTQPFERLDFLFKRIAQAVRTGANFFWTDEKRLVNGFLFENGKPLVYVFTWEVTHTKIFAVVWWKVILLHLKNAGAAFWRTEIVRKKGFCSPRIQKIWLLKRKRKRECICVNSGFDKGLPHKDVQYWWTCANLFILTTPGGLCSIPWEQWVKKKWELRGKHMRKNVPSKYVLYFSVLFWGGLHRSYLKGEKTWEWDMVSSWP